MILHKDAYNHTTARMMLHLAAINRINRANLVMPFINFTLIERDIAKPRKSNIGCSLLLWGDILDIVVREITASKITPSIFLQRKIKHNCVLETKFTFFLYFAKVVSIDRTEYNKHLFHRNSFISLLLCVKRNKILKNEVIKAPYKRKAGIVL